MEEEKKKTKSSSAIGVVGRSTNLISMRIQEPTVVEQPVALHVTITDFPIAQPIFRPA